MWTGGGYSTKLLAEVLAERYPAALERAFPACIAFMKGTRVSEFPLTCTGVTHSHCRLYCAVGEVWKLGRLMQEAGPMGLQPGSLLRLYAALDGWLLL